MSRRLDCTVHDLCSANMHTNAVSQACLLNASAPLDANKCTGGARWSMQVLRTAYQQLGCDMESNNS
jgi:hypothetical protein